MSDKKSGAELLEEPQFNDFGGGLSETPFNSTMDALLTTGDKTLELMCRASKPIAEAASVAYNIAFRFKSKYVIGKVEQIERLSVSLGGQGRAEVVQSLQAGSGVPGEFYENGSPGIKGYAEE